MPRLPIWKLVAATVVLAAVMCAVLLQFRWDGVQASTAAPKIDQMVDVTVILSSFIFSGVCVALAYALYKFRVKPGDESDGAPIHGNTRLEIVWTLIPTVIVLALSGYSWVTLNDIEKRDPDRMVVDVYSQQFAWNFTYPDASKYSAGELHVPVDRQIEFKLHALDVIHSFWVPEWRIKKDNVPGIVTRAIITPDRVGTYQVVCTELCGFGHTTMRAKVVVEPEQQFNAWVAKQGKIPVEFTPGAAEKREPVAGL